MKLSLPGDYQANSTPGDGRNPAAIRGNRTYARGRLHPIYHDPAPALEKELPTVIIAAAEAPPLVAELGIVLAATAIFGYLAERVPESRGSLEP